MALRKSAAGQETAVGFADVFKVLTLRLKAQRAIPSPGIHSLVHKRVVGFTQCVLRDDSSARRTGRPTLAKCFELLVTALHCDEETAVADEARPGALCEQKPPFHIVFNDESLP